MANVRVVQQKQGAGNIALAKQLSGQTAEDMVIKKMAQAGKQIKPMDQKIIFDTRQLVVDAAGNLAGPIIFFGNASSGHPLGIYATNMGRDGSVENNKCWLVKDIGCSASIFTPAAGLDPGEEAPMHALLMGAMGLWNLSTKDPNDRDLVRGMVMHYPSGTRHMFTTGRLDNPAAAAVYLAQVVACTWGDLLMRQKLGINWFIDEGQQFQIKWDGPPIVFGAPYANTVVRVICDMKVTEFTRIN